MAYLFGSYLSSLRIRLLMLFLLAIVPSLGLIFYIGAEQRRIEAIEVQENALRLARLAASNQERLAEGARQLLIALAQLPQVRAGDAAACNRFFAELLEQYPLYVNFGVIALNGDVVCSGLTLPSSPINLADRAYFQRVLETRGFAVGDYQIGRLSGKATVNFSYPVLDEAGNVQAVVFTALDLTWLNQLVAETQLPEGATFIIIDRHGMILARYPDPEQWMGQALQETPLVETILAQDEGTAEVVGLDGISRLYAFTPLLIPDEADPNSEPDANPGAYVSIGIPTEIAFAGVDRTLTRQLAGLGLVSLLALVAAWFGSDLFILKQVKTLINVTRRVSAGDLRARTGLAYGLGELSQLARAFDQMAETLEHEQGFIHILLENLSDGVIACNAEGQLTLFNRTARNWYGQEANVSPSDHGADNSHFDDSERVNQLLAEDSPLMRAFRGEQVRQAEMAIVSPGQPPRYLLVNGDPLFDGAGRKLGAVVVLHDITERKQAVEALQVSQSRLAGIIGSTMDAIITIDAEQRIVLFNAAAEQMFRCSAAEVLGQPLDRFIPSQFRNLHRQHIHAFGQTKVSSRSMGALGAITGLRADGQEFPIEASISQVEAAGQRLYTVILRDITERKRAEEQIQRQTARAKALMNIAARLNAQLNLETVLTTVCEETAHALKVSATAVRLYDPKQDILYYADAFGLPSNYKEYTQPSPGSLYRELIQQYGKLIIATDVQNIPGVPNAKFYICLNVYMVVTALMFREGQLVGALNLFTFDQARHFTEDELTLLTGLADQAAQAITNARLYAQLEAANQELAYSNTELQQFAYVASHDLQEPLRMVASYTQLLDRRYRGKLDSDADEFISYAVGGANRMQRLINDLLSYSRLGTQGKALELTSSESALAQALANLQLAIAENEAVVSHDPLPTVWADETQLVQLFQNLVGNAIKFRSVPPPRIHISAEQRDREWLFSVSDNGIGIEPQYAERIFVIFQRLHSQAEYSGTGIGLAFCKRIVERHGGRIWMESQPGQGATFYFTLPATGGET